MEITKEKVQAAIAEASQQSRAERVSGTRSESVKVASTVRVLVPELHVLQVVLTNSGPGGDPPDVLSLMLIVPGQPVRVELPIRDLLDTADGDDAEAKALAREDAVRYLLELANAAMRRLLKNG